MREKLGVGDKIVIGHVGRFAQPKNHTFILDVFNEIHRMNKNTVLVLCGEGKLEDDIKAKAKALGLENDVIFTGVMDTSVLYQALDLFLFFRHPGKACRLRALKPRLRACRLL